jgi:hypothetical protein
MEDKPEDDRRSHDSVAVLSFSAMLQHIVVLKGLLHTHM